MMHSSKFIFFLFILLPIEQSLSQSIPSEAECSNIDVAQRFDCFPNSGLTESGCLSRGCCFIPNSEPAPSCFYPENYGGYSYVNMTSLDDGWVVYLKRDFPSSYPRDVDILRMDVQYYSDAIVRVKIFDPLTSRYESPYPVLSVPTPVTNPMYTVRMRLNKETPGFQILRAENGEVIFDAMHVGGFIFSDRFLQLTATTSGNLYGLGEHREDLILPYNWTRYTMHNHDVPPAVKTNLYGSHPYYLSSSPNGASHGVFLHSSNTLEVLLQPMPAITFRSLGGILDFYFFMGPTPADVTRQYTNLVGKPLLPPYWGLGFQLCRFGYRSLDDMKKVWQRNVDAGLPFDVQWTDYDYMINHTDFTLDTNTYGGLPEFIEDLHDFGMHYVPMLDPGFSGSEPPGTYPPLDLALEQDVLIKDANGDILYGLVWNEESTVWPDFTNIKAHDYWIQLLNDFHKLVPFDGLWIDMNEPSNLYANGSLYGCPQDDFENPPYVPPLDGGFLSYMTICMNARQAAGRHYDVHNLYGIAEADATNKALRSLGKRPFIISRSTFSGSGKYTGHWSGDNASTWYDLVKSIQEIITSSLLGVSFVGADICGFRENTTQELCNRWSQLGAFYTLSRNHNDQDPAVFDQRTVSSIRKALEARYTLLPYLYTLMYQAHANGDTAIRPLFFEFPEDAKAYEVDLAFLWGPGLYIIPVVEKGATSVTTYLPPGRWYDWYTGKEIINTGQDITLDAPYDTIPLLVRGGTVLPTQVASINTVHSRKNGVELIAAKNLSGEASGSLYWDDGEIIDPVEKNEFGLVLFNLTNNRFTSSVEQWTTFDMIRVSKIKILGSDPVKSVEVNGAPATFSLDEFNVLTISGLSIPLNTPIIATWK